MANALIHETSPYLLQHAHNPVDWHPWGDDALKEAKDENKMLLISIGYAACHWCHVMEHECFEDDEVAALMNKYFVCIKVDREERPDVDQVYMNAAQLINGSGGWPLNALAMPDGRPFFAATYFPKDRWMQLLDFFSKQFRTNRPKLEEQATQLSQGIADVEKVKFSDRAPDFSQEIADQLASNILKIVDKQFGGLSSSQKFPMPSVWEFLLEHSWKTKEKDALKAVESTLINMAQGGIFDQLGGGFSRYATDVKWHVPHFEKMLYDNAQLISLYSHAWQVTGKNLYKKTVEQTIRFVQRELTSPENGFYSSIDADSEKEEGKFYVWSYDEIHQILKEEADLFCGYYGITKNGNWEQNKNIPDIHYGTASFQLAPGELEKRLQSAREKLLAVREKRIHPATDDKILTSWNAMMASGLLSAYRAFGEQSYLELAKNNLDFLLKNVVKKEGGLYRNYKNSKATVHAFLDDYAFFIKALIDYYQVTFEIEYLQKAKELFEYADEHFSDQVNKMFFYTDDQFSNLIARNQEISDNVIPSSNSVMAQNAFVLGTLFEDRKKVQRAATMVNNIKQEMKQNPAYYSNWARLLLNLIKTPFEIAIVGKDAKKKLLLLQKNYLPNATFMGGEKENLPLLTNKLVEGKTMIYVCHNKACQKPVEKEDEAMALIKQEF